MTEEKHVFNVAKFSNTITHQIVERIEELKYLKSLLEKENTLESSTELVNAIQLIEQKIISNYIALGQIMYTELYLYINKFVKE